MFKPVQYPLLANIQSSSPQDPRLIAYWEFEQADDPTEDLSDNGHTLFNTFGGAITYETGANGSGTSIFCGDVSTGESFKAPASADWDITDTNFTIIFSAKVNDSGGGSTLHTVMGVHTGIFDVFWSIYFDNNQRKFNVNNNVNFDTGENSINFGTWYRVAFTFNKTSGLKGVYIDGTASGDDGSTSSINPPLTYDAAGDLNLGSRFNSNGSRLRGNLDSVKIYHDALSAQDVLDEYNAFIGS